MISLINHRLCVIMKSVSLLYYVWACRNLCVRMHSACYCSFLLLFFLVIMHISVHFSFFSICESLLLCFCFGLFVSQSVDVEANRYHATYHKNTDNVESKCILSLTLFSYLSLFLSTPLCLFSLSLGTHTFTYAYFKNAHLKNN